MMRARQSIVHVDHYKWKKPTFIKNPWLRYGSYFVIAVYLLYAFSTLSIDFQRVMRGIPRAMQIFSSAIPPNFSSRGSLSVKGFVVSIPFTLF